MIVQPPVCELQFFYYMITKETKILLLKKNDLQIGILFLGVINCFAIREKLEFSPSHK